MTFLNDLFSANAPLMLLAVAFVVVVVVLSCFRYALLLESTGVKVPKGVVISATVVSQAIGHWAPSPAAMSEFLRFGLMRIKCLPLAGAQNEIPVSSLVATSLWDRVLGQAMIFLIGGVAAIALALFGVERVGMTLILAAGLLCAGFALLFLPHLAPILVSLNQLLPKSMARYGDRVCSLINRLQTMVTSGKAYRRAVVVGGLLYIVNCLITLTVGHALGHDISFLMIVLASSIGSIAVVLPVGFAGIGGHQAAIGSVFILLGASPDSIVAASLAHALTYLLVQSVMGAFFISTTYADVRALLSRRRQASKDGVMI